jgi:hypothetical protein
VCQVQRAPLKLSEKSRRPALQSTGKKQWEGTAIPGIDPLWELQCRREKKHPSAEFKRMTTMGIRKTAHAGLWLVASKGQSVKQPPHADSPMIRFAFLKKIFSLSSRLISIRSTDSIVCPRKRSPFFAPPG